MDLMDKINRRINSTAHTKDLSLESQYVFSDKAVQFVSDITESVDAINIDVNGIFIDRIEKFKRKSDSYVIPSETIELPENVTVLPGYNIVTINDTRYIMPDKIRNDIVNGYENDIIDTLTSGEDFESKLLKEEIITPEGLSAKVPTLTKNEWDYICSRFRNYNARVIMINEELLLKVDKLEVFR